MRIYPAIEIRFAAAADDDLRDRWLAGLDDFAPTAIEESPDRWRVFFDSSSARDAALAWARREVGQASVAAADVPDDDWARRSQADLGAVRAGRIVVTPPWAAEQARAARGSNEIVIVIVPSMGFGTGHHASTRLCLTLMQEIALDGRSVLDLGTGSGVLAIAAACLGASSVTAIDNDPDAIESARENIGLNATPVAVHASVEDLRQWLPSAADLVVANLTGDLLRRAARDVARCTKDGGAVVVSGVLATEEEAVVAAFDAAGLKHAKTIAEEEWVGVRFEKRQARSPGR